MRIVSVVSLMVLLSCGAGAQTSEVLPPAEFQNKFQASSSAIILDVRTPEEFQSGHLNDAINIDFRNEDFRKNLEGLDKSKSYFLYCRSGNRSASAADILEELNFSTVYDLEGGITAWQAAELPVIENELDQK